MTLSQRIEAFSKTGILIDEILQFSSGDQSIPVTDQHHAFLKAVDSVVHSNPWFTKENVLFSLKSLKKILNIDELLAWTDFYRLNEQNTNPLTIGVVMAGNIPFVGFHDFLSVLITGHSCLIKPSSKDDKLLKAYINILLQAEPEFADYIKIEKHVLKKFDAVIATGSNNTSRYFEYYFGKYPHIIRKNRNSVAILNGNETENELQGLATDIFTYFGLGCRNVSKLYIPVNYNIQKLESHFRDYNHVINHHKYANNYDYNKAIYMMKELPFLDLGYLLLREEASLSSPVAVLHYEFYKNEKKLENILMQESDSIQCVVSKRNITDSDVCFGQTQYPNLRDYADNVDTIKFLLDLPVS